MFVLFHLKMYFDLDLLPCKCAKFFLCLPKHGNLFHVCFIFQEGKHKIKPHAICKVVLKNYFRHLPNIQLVPLKTSNLSSRSIWSVYHVFCDLISPPSDDTAIACATRHYCTHQQSSMYYVYPSRCFHTRRCPHPKKEELVKHQLEKLASAYSSSASADRASTKDPDPDLAC